MGRGGNRRESEGNHYRDPLKSRKSTLMDGSSE